MEDGFSLQDSIIGVLGLGLMGGSLALSLKEHCARTIGFDADRATLELARTKKIVDEVESFPSLLKGEGVGVRVDLLILATPVPIILDFLQQLPLLISYPCIIMDIGSTKREILHAMSMLPKNFDPIGGHPICGKEKLGLENADAKLYQNAPFVTASLARTTGRAKSAAMQIISMLGAKQIEMNAEDHDRILAATSHLPFLISSALARSTPHEYSPLVGSGFRSTSRLAGTPSSMMMGILKSNRDRILDAMQNYRSSLNEMETALRNENYAQVEALLNQCRASYHAIIEN
jgi:prephenate dehydrogenase